MCWFSISRSGSKRIVSKEFFSATGRGQGAVAVRVTDNKVWWHQSVAEKQQVVIPCLCSQESVAYSFFTPQGKPVIDSQHLLKLIGPYIQYIICFPDFSSVMWMSQLCVKNQDKLQKHQIICFKSHGLNVVGLNSGISTPSPSPMIPSVCESGVCPFPKAQNPSNLELFRDPDNDRWGLKFPTLEQPLQKLSAGHSFVRCLLYISLSLEKHQLSFSKPSN